MVGGCAEDGWDGRVGCILQRSHWRVFRWWFGRPDGWVPTLVLSFDSKIAGDGSGLNEDIKDVLIVRGASFARHTTCHAGARALVMLDLSGTNALFTLPEEPDRRTFFRFHPFTASSG